MTMALWIALSNIKGIGLKTIKKIYTTFPNLTEENIYDHFGKIKEAFNNSKTIQKILDQEQLEHKIEEAKTLIEEHDKAGVHVIDLASKNYPTFLRLIDDPPVALYCKGNIDLLKDHKQVAIIGTRNPTELGYKAAKKISTQFSEKNYIIVSGLATGIDTAAHIGAVQTTGKTIAVLAGSVEEIYPKENTELAENILEQGGLLLSETPLGTPTHRSAFIQRDRIQSGLSTGVCPVQTALKSGTQHTIKYAQDQNRLLFAPIPLEGREIEVTQGIYHLLDNGLAEKLEDEQDYEVIIQQLEKKKVELLESQVLDETKEIRDSGMNEETEIEQLDIFDV